MKRKKIERIVYNRLPPLLAVFPLLASAVRPVPELLIPLWAGIFALSVLSRIVFGAVFRCSLPPAAGRAFLYLNAGFLIAGLFLFRLARTGDRFGADPEKLTVWHGVLSADSRRLDYGRTGYNIRCDRASGNGFTVSVDCALFVTVKEGEKLRKGQPVTVTGRRSGHSFRASSVVRSGNLAPLPAARAVVSEKLTRTFFIEETSSGAFFEALLLGDRDDLNSVMTDIFRKSGCLHLIALSGMHLGILIGILRLCFGKVIPEKYLNVFLIPLLGIYVILTGSSPSLKRAYTMFTVSSAAGFCGIKLPPADVLCASLIVNALIYPQELYHPGMQLSFAAVFGIVFFSRRLQTSLCRWVPKAAAAPFAVSYAAQIGVAPFLFAMEGINPGGIIASVTVSPLLVLFMYVRFLSVAAALSGMNGIAFPAAGISDAVCDVIVTILKGFSAIPTLPLFPFGVLFFVPFFLIAAGERGVFKRVMLFFLRKKGRIGERSIG